jgi:hypothetical protein
MPATVIALVPRFERLPERDRPAQSDCQSGANSRSTGNNACRRRQSNPRYGSNNDTSSAYNGYAECGDRNADGAYFKPLITFDKMLI